MCVCAPTDNPAQTSSVSVAVKVLDVNDNPPALSDYFDAYVCENAKAGQVRAPYAPNALLNYIQCVSNALEALTNAAIHDI